MALKAKHTDTTKSTETSVEFGIGDKVKVHYKVKERGKERLQIFEGAVIAIKNKGENKSFTVRKIGVQQVGIERIYPLFSPFIDKIEVVRSGVMGARRAKLYYTRKKSKREIESIYTRAKKREQAKEQKPKTSKKSPKKKTAKNAPTKK